MKKRKSKSGSVIHDRGKWVVYGVPNYRGKRQYYGRFDTQADAIAVADALVRARDEGTGRINFFSVSAIAETIFDERETEGGYRNTDRERQRFRTHIANTWLGKSAPRNIRPVDVARLFDELSKKKTLRTVSKGAKEPTKKTLSKNYLNSIKTALSIVFTECLRKGLVDSNPCLGVKLRAFRSDSADDKMRPLLPEEMAAIKVSSQISEVDKCMIQFAWGTGLRGGEQWALELSDVVLKGPRPFVRVRFGSPGLSPKNRKKRIVPLFGEALEALTKWLEILPTYAPENPHNLVFPSPRGCRRKVSQFRNSHRGFRDLLEKAGVDPRTWHDLRHTFGTALLCGWFGKIYTLQEIKNLMGHSTILVTERYARFIDAQYIEIRGRETLNTGAGEELCA